MKATLPPPDTPLIPQFYPLNPNTPVLAFQPQQGRLPTPPISTPKSPLPDGPLPLPIPHRQTQLIPGANSLPYPASLNIPSSKTFYAPTHMPANPRHVPGRALADPTMDLGILIENYKDLIDLIIRQPNADDLARSVPLAELIDVSKLNIRDLPKQSKIDPIFKLI